MSPCPCSSAVQNYDFHSPTVGFNAASDFPSFFSTPLLQIASSRFSLCLFVYLSIHLFIWIFKKLFGWPGEGGGGKRRSFDCGFFFVFCFSFRFCFCFFDMSCLFSGRRYKSNPRRVSKAPSCIIIPKYCELMDWLCCVYWRVWNQLLDWYATQISSIQVFMATVTFRIQLGF